jgi:hypothetical protein
LSHGAIIQTTTEIAMKPLKTKTSIALAAAALLAGVSVAGISAASAAPLQGAKMAPQSSDTLTLNQAQRRKAWNDLYTGALNQKTPPGFSATVGAVVPNSVTTASMTTKAASDVPALKPYHFAMLQKKLVIVNPTDRKIADVITR